MIHDQGTDFSAPLARPAIRENGKSKAVWAAGDRDGEKRTGF